MNIYLAVLSLSYGMWDLLSCGMQGLVPDQGMNLGTLHWEHRVLATGPPVKTPNYSLSLHHIYLVIALSRSCNYALLLYLLVYDLSLSLGHKQIISYHFGHVSDMLTSHHLLTVMNNYSSLTMLSLVMVFHTNHP